MLDVEKLHVTLSPNVSFPPSDVETLKPPSLQQIDTLDISANASMAPSHISLDDVTSRTSHHEYPEGGFRAYLTVFGAFLALFCTFGHMNSFGTYQAWYSGKQLGHLSPSTISWIGSLQLWVFFFSGGPIGQLFDKFGPTWLMVAGTLIYTFSIMMTSLSSQFYQYILAQGILFGLGVGLFKRFDLLHEISSNCARNSSGWVQRWCVIFIEILISVVECIYEGGVVYPIMLQHLFVSVGFGWGVRISGLVSAACCIMATLAVRSLSPPKQTGLSIGVKTFTDTRYVLLAIGSSLVALGTCNNDIWERGCSHVVPGLFIPYFYIVKYAEHLSISPKKTFYVLAVLNAGGIFGRIAPAYLSDSLGRFNLLTPSAFFSGLSCLVFWIFTKSLVSLMIFAAVYGFFSGAFISVITPCVAQISDIRQIGIRIGMLYTIISFP
ncbi:hypothetical protein DXG01_016430 [Tephrocybe rancida]|nr:hypothetical protein DXG01_016430 [Tephrocybe rancida]